MVRELTDEDNDAAVGMIRETSRGPIHFRWHNTDSIQRSLSLFSPSGDAAQGESFESASTWLADFSVGFSRAISLLHNDAVLARTPEGRHVGRLTLRRPRLDERWGEDGGSGILEMVGPLVSHDWRNLGIGRGLLETTFADGRLEDKIVINLARWQEWDLKGTGLAKEGYRQRLWSMVEPFGFAVFPTDEPSIAVDPVNLFTARVGNLVSPALFHRFFQMLFKETLNGSTAH